MLGALNWLYLDKRERKKNMPTATAAVTCCTRPAQLHSCILTAQKCVLTWFGPVTIYAQLTKNVRTIFQCLTNVFLFVMPQLKEQEGIIGSLCPQCMLSTNTGHTDKNILDKSSAMILLYCDGISVLKIWFLYYYTCILKINQSYFTYYPYSSWVARITWFSVHFSSEEDPIFFSFDPA